MAVIVKNTTSVDMMLWNRAEVHRRFGGRYSFQLQGWRIREARSKSHFQLQHLLLFSLFLFIHTTIFYKVLLHSRSSERFPVLLPSSWIFRRDIGGTKFRRISARLHSATVFFSGPNFLFQGRKRKLELECELSSQNSSLKVKATHCFETSVHI
jgi:hypothetical protein